MGETIKCRYCGHPVQRTTGREIYPGLEHLSSKSFLICRPCGAYVGCHALTGEPLGSVAKRDLRALRMEAHQAFDLLWVNGAMSRTEAYGWLSDRLGIGKTLCHIGYFDEETCRQVISLANRFPRGTKTG